MPPANPRQSAVAGRGWINIVGKAAQADKKTYDFSVIRKNEDNSQIPATNAGTEIPRNSEYNARKKEDASSGLRPDLFVLAHRHHKIKLLLFLMTRMNESEQPRKMQYSACKIPRSMQ